jgi:hypothetical protein
VRNDGLAVGAMVTGIIALLCGGLGIAGIVIGPAALIMGIAARKRIQRSNGWSRGQGMATAGIVLGIIATVLSAVWGIVFLANPDLVQDIIDQIGSTTTTTPSSGGG